MAVLAFSMEGAVKYESMFSMEGAMSKAGLSTGSLGTHRKRWDYCLICRNLINFNSV